jgi:hypothetical protein
MTRMHPAVRRGCCSPPTRRVPRRHYTGSIMSHSTTRNASSTSTLDRARCENLLSLSDGFRRASERFPDARMVVCRVSATERLYLPEVLAAAHTSRPDEFDRRTAWKSVDASGAEEIALLVGPKEGGAEWRRLATDAATNLPDSFEPMPILKFQPPGEIEVSLAGTWANYVFNTLKQAGGDYLSVRKCVDCRAKRLFRWVGGMTGPPGSGGKKPVLSTVAFTATDIFAASATAIGLAGLKTTRGSRSSRELMTVPEVLDSWAEIFATLKEGAATNVWKNTEESRRKLRKLHKETPGPIKFPKRGGQPCVEKRDLLEWIRKASHAYVASREHEDQEEVAVRMTVSARYPHGRAGTVVPEIGGHVQTTRKRTT